MRRSGKTFSYDISKPAIFKVRSKNYEDWKKILMDNLNPKVNCVVLLLPCKKTDNALYNSLKELLLEKCPVPSQVVLTSTVERGKNLMSICNKILIQMCAKVGGVPWIVSDLKDLTEDTML